MMNLKWIGIVALASAMMTATSASAQTRVVAGWDFSQYGGSNSLVVDFSFANTYAVDAQFSDLDLLQNPTPGLGAGGVAYNMGTGSGALGRMYHDGSFGSSNTSPGLSFRAASLSLASNQDAPTSGLQMSSTGASNALVFEGQDFGQDLKMKSTAANLIVFEADRTVGFITGHDWQFSFGGQSETGGNLSISVESSPDGSGYTSHGTVTLTPTDSRFEIPLGTNTGMTQYVRLGLVNGALIDNVAIEVIEGTPVPLPLWMLAAIAGGLVIAGRRELPLAG